MKIKCRKCGELIAEFGEDGALRVQVSTDALDAGSFGPDVERPAADRRWWIDVPPDSSDVVAWCRRHGRRHERRGKVRAEAASGKASIRI